MLILPALAILTSTAVFGTPLPSESTASWNLKNIKVTKDGHFQPDVYSRFHMDYSYWCFTAESQALEDATPVSKYSAEQSIRDLHGVLMPNGENIINGWSELVTGPNLAVDTFWVNFGVRAAFYVNGPQDIFIHNITSSYVSHTARLSSQ